MTLLAGTSGYAFKEWKGVFYPDGLPESNWLGFYSGKFPTVEINNTFYRLPKRDVLLGWAEQVPEQFTFAIKASQRITHFARLKEDAASALDYLLQTTSALGSRLGPTLFQLPPNMQQDVQRLKGFLGLLPPGRRFAIEFRHESWFDETVFATLRDRDVAMVVAEQEDFKCPVQATASWGYLRLHRLDYDASALGTWAKCVAGQSSWTDAYVYFKHDEGTGSGPPAVEAFARLAEDA